MNISPYIFSYVKFIVFMKNFKDIEIIHKLIVSIVDWFNLVGPSSSSIIIVLLSNFVNQATRRS